MISNYKAYTNLKPSKIDQLDAFLNMSVNPGRFRAVQGGSGRFRGRFRAVQQRVHCLPPGSSKSTLHFCKASPMFMSYGNIKAAFFRCVRPATDLNFTGFQPSSSACFIVICCDFGASPSTGGSRSRLVGNGYPWAVEAMDRITLCL